MVLFLHNRYRTSGGEERVVEELMALVREQLGEPAELLARDSGDLGRARAAAGLLRGGLAPADVGKAVRVTGARVLHAHNLNPLFGWRALAAAKGAGARVVLHLHQYRLVCATGVCFTGGEECTRCHGRNTLPGVIHNCRGGRSEALAYGASLALWQRRMTDQADAVIVPSAFARERLRELGAPLAEERVHVVPPPVRLSERPAAVESGTYALVVSRLAPEKGVDVAIEACRIAGVPLLVAGDGPEHAALREQADAAAARDVRREGAGAGSTDGQARVVGASEDTTARFVGQVDDVELAHLRAGAALAIVPSRSAETFGMAAAEAMAAGLPVAASRIGALPELVGEEGLVAPGDAAALAQAIGRLWGDPGTAARARALARAKCAPEAIASMLRDVYGAGPTAASVTSQR
ncbi:MAG TPA: glycosyltransferase family 4 protein [Solirubrobacteraceae bacterium]|jgi:glycosyltransferase involved in cell wall biosynthesis|nr:glycosyltransferase family 4 protein [Solirubrobacteraceae bacterium]